MAKDKKNLVTTPRMIVAGFTAIQKPTWDFNKTTQEFQIKVAMDADKAAPFLKRMQALVDAEFDAILEANPKLKKVLKKIEIGTVEYDDDGEETGRILFGFKQKAEIAYIDKKTGEEKTFKKKVGLVDSKGQHIKAAVRIGSGSEVIISFEPNAYYTAKDKEVGMSFNRLAGVQLLKLVEYDGAGEQSAEDMGFGAVDDEDGFDAGAYTADPSSDEGDGEGYDSEDPADF